MNDLEWNASHEAAVRKVLAAGLSTGHADTPEELMDEVLWQYQELLNKFTAQVKPNPQ